jgi:hypothetical protein
MLPNTGGQLSTDQHSAQTHLVRATQLSEQREIILE